MKKVVKFGGSSLASAEQFRKAGSIIRNDSARRYVIPSAPGKRNPDDTKVTDMLYQCYKQAILDDDREQDFEEILAQIKQRYDEIISGLNLELSLDEAKDLLASAGFALSRSSKTDIIVAYFLQNKIYDMFEINDVLDAYGQPVF